MIKEDDIIEIGKFQKTHALKGELNAVLDICEDYLTEDNPVIVDMDGIFVPFYAESVRPKGSTSYLIKLQGVDSIEEASKFVNKAIYGLRNDMLEYFDADDEDVALPNELEGYEVIDSEIGSLGTLVRIDDTTINTLMIIDGGAYGEIYIPFNEEFIDRIDDENREIITSVPEELLSININKKDNE